MEINHVCSLGTLCHSASFLKRNNLKLCSFPFDWIFSNNNTVIDCIKNDFNIFLDKTYYRSIEGKKCGHSIYGNDYFFNHHNPLIHEGDYNYYVRCVNRFKNLLRSEGTKLFLMMSVNNEKVDEEFKNSIISFNEKFSEHTNDYVLLVILHIKEAPCNYHFSYFHDNIHFLELYTLSRSDGIHFYNETDNQYLDNIIKTDYSFVLKPSY